MEIDKDELQTKLKKTGSAAGDTAKKLGKVAGARAKIMSKAEVAGAVGIATVLVITGAAVFSTSGDNFTPEPMPMPDNTIQEPIDEPIDEPIQQPSEPAPYEDDEPMGEDWEDYEPVGESEPDEIESYSAHLTMNVVDPYGNGIDKSTQIDIQVYNGENDDLLWASKGTVGNFNKEMNVEIPAQKWSDYGYFEVRVVYDGIEIQTPIEPSMSTIDKDVSDNDFEMEVEIQVMTDYVQIQLV